jgi:diaminopimelate epimerase
MHFPFVKYQGTGNDFILIDDRSRILPTDDQIIQHICDRHFGIGADGVLLLRNSSDYDFEMVYYNPDGSEATFCGNGGRCIVAFAQSLELIGSNTLFKAADGIHKADILFEEGSKSMVKLGMQDAIIYESGIRSFYLNTGTYHYVVFIENIDQADVLMEGRRIRNLEKFAPHGTNVNFVKLSSDFLEVRTYEKGVESETLSCGTGVTASAIAASFITGKSRYHIKTKGGELTVEFQRDQQTITQVTLEGLVTRVFEGQFSY